MTLYDAMVMKKYDRDLAILVVVVVVDIQSFDLVHERSLNVLDDYRNRIDVVLPLVTCVDRMYLDVVRLHVVDLVANRKVTNESIDTAISKKHTMKYASITIIDT
jgi:hypothetical protein